MAVVGYARVSTLDQDPGLQEQALTDVGCDKIFTDHASGVLTQRPQLDAALAYLRPGDTLVTWKLDRLGRSLRHLIDVVADLERREVGFRSLTEALDTGSAAGKLLFHLLGALAEFERCLIQERTRAGLVAARAKGRRGGRKPKMTEQKRSLAKRMLDDGSSPAEIAQVLGVSRATVYRHMQIEPSVTEAAAT